MRRLINKQQASHAVEALNQIERIKKNLESIKNYQGDKKPDKNNKIDELTINLHFKTIERELKILKSYAEYNLKRTGWSSKYSSKYSANPDTYLILDKIISESANY
tara:strand:+ start:149 stop:466 length:318 start_codon:yes stop_codon:yes gene_type:complete